MKQQMFSVTVQKPRSNKHFYVSLVADNLRHAVDFATKRWGTRVQSVNADHRNVIIAKSEGGK